MRTRATKEDGREVLEFVRWVMVAKRDLGEPGAGSGRASELPDYVAADRLTVPAGLRPRHFDRVLGLDVPLRQLRGRRAHRSRRRHDHRRGRAPPRDAPLPESGACTSTRSWRAEAASAALVYGGHVLSIARRCPSTASATSCTSARSTAARTPTRCSRATRSMPGPRSWTRPRSPAIPISARCVCAWSRPRTCPHGLPAPGCEGASARRRARLRLLGHRAALSRHRCSAQTLAGRRSGSARDAAGSCSAAGSGLRAHDVGAAQSALGFVRRGRRRGLVQGRAGDAERQHGRP